MTLYYHDYHGGQQMMVTEGRICPDDPDLNNGGEANGKSIFVIVAITIIWRIICRAWIRIDAFIGFQSTI